MPTEPRSSLDPDTVRHLAYELWEREGRPAGRELDFWLQAERELAAGPDSPPPAAKGRARRKSTATDAAAGPAPRKRAAPKRKPPSAPT